jgi:ER membrane protein complex subunit 4
MSWHGAFDLNCQSAALATTSSSSSSDGGGRGGGASALSAVGFRRERETALTGGNEAGSTAGNLDKQVQIMTKMSWAIAMAPGKQLPMMLFMMWMTGNGLHLFSIMMTGMALWTPVKSTMALNTAFQNIRVPGRDIQLLQQKLVYLGCCVAGLCIGAWKLDKMGLLPLTSADWASMVPVNQYVEFSG